MFSTNFKASRTIFAALAALTLVLGLVQPASATAGITATGFATTNTVNSATTGSSAVDSSGNMYLAGWAGSDMFITKFSSARATVWSKLFTSTSGAGAQDIALSPTGNLVASGWFCGNFNLGGAVGTRTSLGACDGFVLTLDAAGNSVAFTTWAEAGAYNGSSGVGVDSAGNIYAAADVANIHTQGITGIDGFTWNEPINQAGDLTGDVIIKYNSSLQIQYVKPLPSGFSVTHWPNAFAITPSGKVLVGGSVRNTTNFGSSGIVTLSSIYEEAVWLQLDGSGNIEKLKSYVGADSEFVWAITFDRAGNIYVAIEHYLAITIGGTSYPATAGNSAVVKYDAVTNSVVWVRDFGATSGFVYGFNLVADASGNVVFTGNYSSSMAVGSVATLTTQLQNNAAEVFVIGINADGTFAWGRTTQSSSGDDWALARTFIFGTDLYLAGTFRGTLDFGDGISATSQAGVYDGYVAKFSVAFAAAAPLAPNSNFYSAPPQNQTPTVPVVALPPIQFSSISPKVIDSLQGATVNVSGSNMSKVTSVSMGSTALSFKLVGDQLQISVPAHAVGYADLTFKTSDGSIPLSNAIQFSDVLNTHLAVITLVNPTKSALAKAQAKFVKITYTDRVVTKGKQPKVTITLTGRIKN